MIGCLVLCGNICHPDLSVDIPYAVGSSLWSLGSGSAPPGPPAPGRLHRSISWAGTLHHVCVAISGNTWCSVFLLTCTIHWSSSTKSIIVIHHLTFAEAHKTQIEEHEPELNKNCLNSADNYNATGSKRSFVSEQRLALTACKTILEQQKQLNPICLLHLCARPFCMTLVQVNDFLLDPSIINLRGGVAYSARSGA